VQDLAVFARFVHIQDENQAGGVRSGGIVSRETGRRVQEFCGLGRFFSLFQGRGSSTQGPIAREGIEIANIGLMSELLYEVQIQIARYLSKKLCRLCCWLITFGNHIQ
jgi:hypothetical protein